MEQLLEIETQVSVDTVHTTGSAVVELSERPIGNIDEIIQYALTREAANRNNR